MSTRVMLLTPDRANFLGLAAIRRFAIDQNAGGHLAVTSSKAALVGLIFAASSQHFSHYCL